MWTSFGVRNSWVPQSSEDPDNSGASVSRNPPDSHSEGLRKISL